MTQGAFEQLNNRQGRSQRFPDGQDLPSKYSLIYDDPNFDDGYRGWSDHMTTPVPFAPISLSPYPALGGLSLKLSTSVKRSTVPAATCTAIKRLWRPKEATVVYFENWWSYGAEQLTAVQAGETDAAGQPATIAFGLDTQRWNNPSEGRSFFQFRYAIFDNTSQECKKQFAYINDEGKPTYIAGSAIDIGPNENKQGIVYTRCAFDLAANGGKGEYKELAVGQPGTASMVFDLTGCGARGKETLQTASSFSGGMNPVVAIFNRNLADNGHAWVNLCASRLYIGG